MKTDRLSSSLQLLLVTSLALLVVTGCRSRVTGKEGNLEFSYSATEDVLDFNKPIAVGARLDVKVAESGSHRTIDLVSAESDKPDVLNVRSFSSDTLVLEGAGSGNALISVTARVPSGDELPDSINMAAKVPDVLEMSHACTNESRGLYLVDQEIAIHFDMEMNNGQPVIGYGYHPVDIEPAVGLQLDLTSKAQEFMRFRTAATPQTVTLASQIDDTKLTLVLIEPGSINGAALGAAGALPARVDRDHIVHVRPTVDGKPVCQAKTRIQAATLTPDICDVSAGYWPDDLPTDTLESWGFVTIRGKEVGFCRFSVTHVAGDGGQGITSEHQVEVDRLVRP